MKIHENVQLELHIKTGFGIGLNVETDPLNTGLYLGIHAQLTFVFGVMFVFVWAKEEYLVQYRTI